MQVTVTEGNGNENISEGEIKDDDHMKKEI